MYKTTFSPRNINMKSQIHYLNTQLHIMYINALTFVYG